MNMTMSNYSLRNRFTQRDVDSNPILVLQGRSECSNVQMQLIRQQASFTVKEQKKTKHRSATWVVTLTSPLEALHI